MRLPLLFLIPVAAVVSSCSPTVNVRSGNFNQDKALATTEVVRFHERYNADQFATIYNEADPLFQKSANQSAITSSMQTAKQRFGNIVSAVKVGENAFPGGQVRVVYNLKCALGNASEQFIWQSDGQKVTLQMVKMSPGTVKPSEKFKP